MTTNHFEFQRKTGIILALDVTDEENAIRVTEAVADMVDAVKIGYPLVLGTGLQIVSKLSRYAPIIADFKVADIPNTDRLICEHVFKAGCAAIIVQGFTGPDSLAECVKTANEFGGKVFVVSEMSHPGGDYFFTDEISKEIAALAKKSGAFGIVAPATRPERVKELRAVIGADLKIISPGVGAQGGSAADTIKAGADWVIVGRSIYNAADPKAEAEKVKSEIEKLI
ncbi:Orotidine 5'-phosphate decarboxylase [Methanimicrococcus stummii]|uniref:Orotidine 5'-phosphate decarboxylase n=1 Tax=Methanimicrococcus stummii TaxID=3028294 RepID=A0AA96V800_9EURY|nr:orotidine-5'-phosphate decarboxylase [Methanimicrococcus sp. Es2]WNY27883.1 Orotidine 5'-phosphate decarboxylase [Methanimicrococcus sp. Es2]